MGVALLPGRRDAGDDSHRSVCCRSSTAKRSTKGRGVSTGRSRSTPRVAKCESRAAAHRSPCRSAPRARDPLSALFYVRTLPLGPAVAIFGADQRQRPPVAARYSRGPSRDARAGRTLVAGIEARTAAERSNRARSADDRGVGERRRATDSAARGGLGRIRSRSASSSRTTGIVNSVHAFVAAPSICQRCVPVTLAELRSWPRRREDTK